MKDLLVYTDGNNLYFSTEKNNLPIDCPDNAWFVGEIINFTGSLSPTFSMSINNVKVESDNSLVEIYDEVENYTKKELQRNYLLSFFINLFNDNCIESDSYKLPDKEYTFNFKGFQVNIQYSKNNGQYVTIVQDINNEHNYKVFESLSINLDWMEYIHEYNRENRMNKADV